MLAEGELHQSETCTIQSRWILKAPMARQAHLIPGTNNAFRRRPSYPKSQTQNGHSLSSPEFQVEADGCWQWLSSPCTLTLARSCAIRYHKKAAL
jgi:hypothetical protein